MADWKVPLADVVVLEEDIQAVSDVYRSGWLSMGPETERLEAELAAYVGARHALAAANGTAALHLICLAAGLGPGHEVVVPSLTFVATVNAIAYTGARPVFADIAALDRPWLSAAAAEAALGPKTAAIMTMTYGGHPGETPELAELADARGVALLEDAAHAIGARAAGRHLGTFGAAGAFSFFSNKNLAVGEGGALVTDDDELAERARLLRSHGMTTLTWERHKGHAASYDVVALGFNYRIDEPRAVLARHRLHRLDSENARRAEIDARYRALLADAEGVTPALPPAGEARCAHHLFPVLLDESIDRDRFRSALGREGVQTSLHYPPVHSFSIYADGAPDLPVTDAFSRRAVTLPLFGHMTDSQQDLVVDAVRRAAAQPGYGPNRPR
ncbi:MAG TPA: DegT/DnrJ/EryC1/StrS family aminotransferase [Thermoleophilaceae bacterium]|nr:DegT/DnrJ/EryC1/StrS family aminotransferase [Thermoleophilaceae bacterium]